jgi:hypothetical protein
MKMEIKTLVKRRFKVENPHLVEEREKKLRKEHEKLVKGMFEFVDAQGGWLDFSYRWFKGEDIKTIRLIHGEICELPMGIVRHLNNTYKKIRRMAADSPDKAADLAMGGKATTYTTQSRIRFTPMEAM